MAIFGSKKTGTKKAAAPGGLSDVVKTVSSGAGGKKLPVVAGVSNVIRRPRLTEKAANLSSLNIYTFDVVPGASKQDVARALLSLYKVTPAKINVVNTKGKDVSLRTRRGKGTQNKTRKAYVYLKKGDTIDFAA